MTPIDCPVCRAPFREVLTDGVLIDVCSRCSGVWLDRGELEELLRRRRHAENDDAGPAGRR
jgi:Zn-finger nucleic acid-binding protein